MIRTLGVRLLKTATLALAFAAVCHAQNVLTHHTRPATTNGKAPFLGPLPSSQALRLTVVLPLRNEAGLDTLLEDLYNPNSSSYHHFLTVDQFAAEFGPTQDDYDTTIAYLQEHGLTVTGTSRNRLNINVAGPASAVQAAFHVKIGLYQHDTENRSFYAPDREPTVDLPFPLWHISGLDNYSTPHPVGLDKRPAGSTATSNATTGSGPSASFLGSDMRAAYYGGTLTGSGQSVGLLEYYGTDLADLNTYFTNAHQTNNVPITLLSTDGTSTSCVYSRAGGRCDDIEQTLDMTQALGMAPGLSSLVMYVGSSDTAIFNAMATANPLNAQLGSSWTWGPADPSTDDPYFKEFAAQGQNLFQAAGDSGKWTSTSSVFPSDDVYITSVGGTDLVTTSAGGPWSSETTWSSGGGGISPNKFALPSWQTATASGCSSCSKSYRNGPDVSANSNYTFYVCGDQTTCTANTYGGTSFAAPMWAGYMALVNQQSVANGGQPVGFINPALYSYGLSSSYNTDFHDITSGSNGFSATTGYDLATGWGSPNGSALIDALAGSPATAGYTLSASPASVSVVQGNSGSSTITSTVSGGYNSAVNLSASGQPSGVTVTFSPTSITGTGSATMNIAVDSTATTGNYTITVTGTSGSTTQTTTVSLNVTAAQTGSFSLSASPSSVSVVQGNSGSSTITSTVTGNFSSAVNLTASGQPSGVSVTFSPSSITGTGNATMNIAVGSSVATGNYTITVTGTAGSSAQTTAVSLTVTAAQTATFSLSTSPASLTLSRGHTGSTVVTATPSGGFSSPVTLSASGLPSGVTGTFTTNPIQGGSGTSALNVSASNSAHFGTYTVTITGTGGNVTKTTTFSLQIKH